MKAAAGGDKEKGGKGKGGKKGDDAAQSKQVWRMVPKDLKFCWTRTELHDDFVPEAPGEFEEQDAIFFNASVVPHPVNARHLTHADMAAAKMTAIRLKKKLGLTQSDQAIVELRQKAIEDKKIKTKEAEARELAAKINAPATFEKARAFGGAVLQMSDTKRRL